MYKNTNFGMSVEVVDKTLLPQTLVYLKMHQCYYHQPVTKTDKTEKECGDIIVKRLLAGNRGHFSPFEGATVTVSLQYIPHSVLQQLLRSRIGVSPSVQSFRYTSKQFAGYEAKKISLEQLVYIRPAGIYHDRETKYEYTPQKRAEDVSLAEYTVKHVAKSIREGMPPEQARSSLVDYRQHSLVTFNARSLMGFLDRRLKKDSQIEIRVLAELMHQMLHDWMPETAVWYSDNRAGKAMLAP